MVDILDDSFENNSMNLSLKENDRIHPVLKEKETYEKTNKLLEDEFNSSPLNGHENKYYFSLAEYIENKDQNDNESFSFYFKTIVTEDKDIKSENENLTESNNKNILIEGKKVVKNENLNKADNITMNNIKKENEEDKNIKDTTKKRGRKNKGSNIKGNHTKKDEDNLKIKKLPKSFMEDVSKEKNEPLFKMKISEILCEQEISTKYSTFGKF